MKIETKTLGHRRKATGFTLIEVMGIILFLAILAAIYLPQLYRRQKSCSAPMSCANNLKQIGTAYRIWANDNGDRYPASQTAALGGWKDFLEKANQGAMTYTNYALMENEMGQSPKVVVCPSDERQPAQSFSNFSNTNISYFVGVSASDSYPQSLLSGDRNLAPGLISSNDFGYSPPSGRGNDVFISTNSAKSPVCWSLKMHSAGTSVGSGNVLLGDGSAQQLTSAAFRLNWQPNLAGPTNWPPGFTNTADGMRLLFP